MPRQLVDLYAVPAPRRAAIERIGGALRPGMTVALSTHINADGDGCGSQAALARLLAQRDVAARIVNPTPWPEMYVFLLGDDVREQSAHGSRALRDVDALVVLDINDVRRLGSIAEAVRALRVPKMVIDHHVTGDEPAGEIVLADTTACATGELVFDLARVLELDVTPTIARALYTALLTDTGGFRFSNTSPRCHAIAGQLLAAGVDPEEMYRRVYASHSLGRLQLLRDALATLAHDPGLGLSWISLEAGLMERYGVSAEELDGIAEHARSVAGTRLAIFFRDLGHGHVKVSFRSTGDTDVNRFARQFGGGGHTRAAGALIAGTLEEVREQVVREARAFLDAAAAR